MARPTDAQDLADWQEWFGPAPQGMIAGGHLSGCVTPCRGFATSAADRPSSPGELAHRGTELFDQRVRPTLRPDDDGKFVAIDIRSGDFEVHEDDYAAVTRLRARHPGADVWLERAGLPTAYQMRTGR